MELWIIVLRLIIISYSGKIKLLFSLNSAGKLAYDIALIKAVKRRKNIFPHFLTFSGENIYAGAKPGNRVMSEFRRGGVAAKIGSGVARNLSKHFLLRSVERSKPILGSSSKDLNKMDPFVK